MQKNPIISFRHSGKMGDLLYSLILAKSFGKANMYINIPTELMNINEANILLPLIKEQPYINKADIYKKQHFDIDLDEFRLIGNTSYAQLSILFLARWHKYVDPAKPWIFINEPKFVNHIIINRTERYMGRLDYGSIIRTYPDKCTFIGTEQEHTAFQNFFHCELPYYKTNDLLEAAQVIAGANIFIGNQSVCWAIAEGMKKEGRLLETSIDMPNCIPIGGGYSDWEDKDLEIVAKFVS